MERGNKIKVTISAGATLAKRLDSIERVIERADLLMYKSKKGGRNCVNVG